MILKLITLIFLTANLVGCRPSEWPEPKPKPRTAVTPVIWKKGLQQSGLTSTPHYYNGTMIFGHPAKEKNNYLVYCLNPKNGDSLWQTRIVTPYEFDPFDIDNSVMHENIIVLSERKRMFVLNADNGEILWKYEDAHNYKGICIIEGYIYIADLVLRETSTMCRFNISTGDKEALFTIRHGKDQPGGDFTPYLMMPVKWIHPSGDEILVLQNGSYGHDKLGLDGMYGYSKMDLMAYNLTADSILWYRYEVDNFSSTARPAIDGNKVYFYGDRHAYCINPLNGETLWKYFIGNGPEDDFNTANILIIDNKLIVKPDNDAIHAVNKETGELVWYNPTTASMPYMLTYRKDTIWFSSGGVLAIDANTGETLIDQWDNDHQGSWIFPVAFHPTNGNIYTSDASNFYCLDPKKMK
jgi:outer membrane protein assembly factor BamB